MILKIGVENGMDGRSLAWALDFPGCFADGPDEKTAIIAMPQAFIKYKDWISRHTADSWLADILEIDIRLVEAFDGYFINPENFEPAGKEGIEINAWFRHDWKPLSEQEIWRGLQLLGWSRMDLLASVEGLSEEQLDKEYPGERWSIRGILAHVATAEWWYLDRLGLAAGMPKTSLPRPPIERLNLIRGQLSGVLPELANRKLVLGTAGEFWSPRKLLRRAIWHELDHIGHIYKLRLS